MYSLNTLLNYFKETYEERFKKNEKETRQYEKDRCASEVRAGIARTRFGKKEFGRGRDFERRNFIRSDKL